MYFFFGFRIATRFSCHIYDFIMHAVAISVQISRHSVVQPRRSVVVTWSGLRGMQRLARACLVIPTTYPTALAFIAHYERKRKQKPCVPFLHLDDSSRRDSQPERSCGLATSRSPTVDVRGLAVMHTAVTVASGHHTGGSPGGSPGGSLGGSPGDSPGGSLGDSPGGIPGDSLGGSPVGSRGVKRSPPGSPVPSSPSSSSSRRTPRVQAKLTVTIADGEAAAKFRAGGTAGRKWLSTFMFDRWAVIGVGLSTPRSTYALPVGRGRIRTRRCRRCATSCISGGLT